MNADRLSPRLWSVASMVTAGNSVYDVGCDHAFLTLYLVKQGIARDACACDVNPGPLKAAREHVREAGLEDVIQTVLSDGLMSVPTPRPPATLIMAGMGGGLILDVLRARPEVTDAFEEVIISPQSRVEETRTALRQMGLCIALEEMVRDAGKYYVSMKLVREARDYSFGRGDESLSAKELDVIRDRYGPVLIDEKPEILREYLEREHGILKEILSHLEDGKHVDERREILAKLHVNEMLTGGLYGNDQNRR